MEFKPYFFLNKQEKSGVFFLLLIIVVLQLVFFYMKSTSRNGKGNFTVDAQTQAQIDSLKKLAVQESPPVLYPFNPNYISDYKGYTLGMSSAEISRLHAYREKDLYVNTPNEFQKVTQVSDSLLHQLAPYFKFPDWIKIESKVNPTGQKETPGITSGMKAETVPLKDLNSVTAEELKSIYGIGDKLSQRIVKFRNRLGGFLVNEQLNDVYGLEPEVVERTLLRFQVLEKPVIEKININTASVKKLSELVYIEKSVAYKIVDYRIANGGIDSFEELLKVENFPIEKIDRIKLYLAF